MADIEVDAEQVASVRAFNRFYTRAAGLLGRYLGSPWSLTEARVLYELFARDGLSASQLCEELGLDPGYLSRLLRRFEAAGQIERRPDPDDRRRSLIALTGAGRAGFAPYDAASRQEVGALLARLRPGGRTRLVRAMAEVEDLLSGRTGEVEIRRHRPGDISLIVAAQARIYHQEYGWNHEYEPLAARIAADFIEAHDPLRERAFVAERGGEVVGAVFCVDAGKGVAKLRLLHVEASERGSGLGRRLVRDCIAFAREASYRRMTLWTNDVLSAARAIYQAEGFVMTASQPHHSFGADLVGETWELDLTAR
ncbi:GNAT family N-acetyltransferase [Phreatobacter sp.]|uniref:GNAT family N-acetyltransferase n=1 Tax=Phreatobacter sp. TaxID=1966341 RepID=UPI003F71BB15